MSAEPLEAEIVSERTVAALAVPDQGHPSALVRAAGTIAEVEEVFHDYQSVYARLLADSDFQTISGKRFPKKSAWRKLSGAFGVSFSIGERVYERSEAGRIIRAEFVVRATAPNGRYSDGFGACDLFEKCCLPGCRKSHTHCAAECDGRKHFSNPQHDIPATAETRAKNRAASDLFGMGEVSAEEMSVLRDEKWWGGWESEDDMRSAHGEVTARLKEADEAVREDVKAWLDSRGWRLWLPKDDFEEWADYALTAIAKEPPIEPDEGPADAEHGMDHMMQPTFVRRVGKKAAGRVLDGRTWDEFPESEGASVDV